jgi:general secretion pathway protein B
VSFILDALRKSEHARQNLGNTSIAELPLGRRPRGQPWWIFAIAALLLINLVVLTIVLLRGEAKTNVSSAPQVAAVSQAPAVAQITTSPVVPQSQTAMTRPLSEEAAPPQIQYDTVARSEIPPTTPEPALVKRVDAPPAAGPVIATTPEGLPELHIDMHVYAKQPPDRFVFINMRKYMEGQTLVEGPRVNEITPDGVVLFYKGQQLHLSRP